MKQSLILLLSVSLFISCNNNNGMLKKNEGGGGNDDTGGWSKSDKNAFLGPCQEGLTGRGYSSTQARQLCNCGLEKLEKKYSSLKEGNEKGGEAAGAQAMQECAAGGGNNDTGGWSETDRNKFLNDCGTSLNGNPQGQQICSCVLKKLEKKYSSLKEADRDGVDDATRFAQECMGGGNDDNDN